ncbi:AraC family transcriptional regulator [Psychromonas algicola]|uniref:AraC family transcriptional regulator n=1 Tax=Psychromonas algicola TaxID=2555642 RepID=UPI001068268D|nr:GyrI-like domain-containing protein [Psychromonas sp. RZ5]TEW52666.1 AraC family transcriptional regulator [Psychromonas sp. RZ5]
MNTNQHVSRINDVLYFIHQDISNALLAKDLANIAAYSEQHFHRLFKLVVGESVHVYIRRIRMEFAANQLMFDNKASVLEIANKSGFSSLSSFSRAFKSTFNMSPGQWRNHDYRYQRKSLLADQEIAANYLRLQTMDIPKYKLVELPARHVAYVRHQGYDRSIANAWQTLKAWANMEGRDFSEQFGLHHSNPAWVELKKCRYVACVEIDSPILRRGVVNSMTIPAGLHAVFQLEGKYGELLPQLSHILEHWLPDSGYKMQSTPAYVHYKKNQFLTEEEAFSLRFCLPISLFG